MIGLAEPWGPILAAWATFVVATASPGPAVLATAATAARDGRSAGIAFGLGVCVGSLSWAFASALGLSALVVAEPRALSAIRIGGGLFLLWLASRAALSALRPARVPDAVEAPPAPTIELRAHALRGLFVHLGNPKAALAWIAILAIGAPPGAPGWVFLVILAGTACFALAFYTGVAVLVSTPRAAAGYARARRRLDWALAGVFGFVGLRLIWP